jgi:hypothetical protein
MGIEEFNEDQKIQLYTRKNRVYVSFSYDPEVVKTVKLMKKWWWSSKLREWSFDIDCLNDFVGLHDDVHMLKHNVIIWRMPDEICFKLLNDHDQDMVIMMGAIPNVMYDPENRVFCIPIENMPELEQFINDHDELGLLRIMPPRITIKRKL